MAKMIEIELAHWIDPDTIYEMYTTDDKEVRGGHTYYKVLLRRSSGFDTAVGKRYTLIQANKLMKRIANAQSKPGRGVEKP